MSSMRMLYEYKFWFNGQVKDDEIYGSGNAYSAQYWEYDARLGRRWNLDPVDQVSISNYACFGNNPNIVIDPLGDELKLFNSFVYKPGMTMPIGLTDNEELVFETIDNLYKNSILARMIIDNIVDETTVYNIIIHNTALSQYKSEWKTLFINTAEFKNKNEIPNLISHELAHIWDEIFHFTEFFLGKKMNSEWVSHINEKKQKVIITQSEKFAIHIENIVKKEIGVKYFRDEYYVNSSTPETSTINSIGKSRFFYNDFDKTQKYNYKKHNSDFIRNTAKFLKEIKPERQKIYETGVPNEPFL